MSRYISPAPTFAAGVIMWAVLTASSAWANPDDTLGARFDLIRESCVVNRNEYTHDVLRRITVLNARGDEYAEIVLSESKYLQVDDVRISVSRADGTVIATYTKEDMDWQQGFSEQNFADDIKQYYLKLSPPQYPFTIEYAYRRKGASLMFLPVFVVQRSVPVGRAEFEMTAPSEMLLHYRAYPTHLEPETVEEGGRLHRRWEFDDVPPLPDIEAVPPGYNEPIYVLFAADHFELEGIPLESCTWEGIGRWHSQLSEGRYLPVPEGGTLPPADPRAVIHAEYDRMISEMRYVAIEVGLGGWQPRRATLTEQRKFGDCKDLATLLTSRLRNAGIAAYTACLLTRNAGVTDTTFPAVLFNHVISLAVVEGDTIWMDPTCNQCPLGELPLGDEATVTLVSADDGGRLCLTRPSTANDNVTTRAVTLMIQPDYSVAFDASIQAVGNYALYLRSVLDGSTPDEQRRVIEASFPEVGTRYVVDSFSVSRLNMIYEPVQVRVFGHSVRPERVFRSTLYHNPYLMHATAGLLDLKLEGRAVPIDLYYPRTIRDILTVSWAAGLAVDSAVAPPEMKASYSFGDVSVATRAEPNAVTVELTRRQNAYLIPVEQFGEFDRYRQALREIYKGYVKLALGS